MAGVKLTRSVSLDFTRLYFFVHKLLCNTIYKALQNPNLSFKVKFIEKEGKKEFMTKYIIIDNNQNEGKKVEVRN